MNYWKEKLDTLSQWIEFLHDLRLNRRWNLNIVYKASL